MSVSLEQVIGHEHIVSSLKNSIASKRISHAYIFSGERGQGKTLVARGFAKALQCENGTGCGHCLSCKVFESGNHPDIFYISPGGKSLGVDDVREKIIKNMETKPYKYQYKIFIIKEAHTMTPQAQNALLKTIEEPSGYGIFMLVSDGIGAFLPTVLSRCIVYKLKPVGERLVLNYLTEQNDIPENLAKIAAVYAQGNIGKAMSLASDNEFISMREQVIDILKRVSGCNLALVFALVKELEPFKERVQDVLDIIYMWYRDMLVLKTDMPEYLIQRDYEIQINEQGCKNTVSGIINKLDAVWSAKRQIKQYGNYQLIMEVMFLELHN